MIFTQILLYKQYLPLKQLLHFQTPFYRTRRTASIPISCFPRLIKKVQQIILLKAVLFVMFNEALTSFLGGELSSKRFNLINHFGIMHTQALPRKVVVIPMGLIQVDYPCRCRNMDAKNMSDPECSDWSDCEIRKE